MDNRTIGYLSELNLPLDKEISTGIILAAYDEQMKIYCKDDIDSAIDPKVAKLTEAKNYLLDSITIVNNQILEAQKLKKKQLIEKYRAYAILAVVVIVLAAAIAIPVRIAAQKTAENRAVLASISYLSNEDGTYTISIGSKCTQEELSIPDEYNGAAITKIKTNGNPYVKKIVFNDKISSIEEDAFKGCSSLTSINLKNVSSISLRAFSNCTKLSEVNMPNVTCVSEEAFSGCVNLENINLPKVITISPKAFYNCTKMRDVNMPFVEVIGSEAFSGCSSIENIALQSAKSINEKAFLGCSSLESVSFANAYNLTFIGKSAFMNCSSLTDFDLTNTDSLTKIESDVLTGTAIYNSIKHGYFQSGNWIVFAQGINEDLDIDCNIADSAFYSIAKHIKSMRLGPNCKYIGNSAFYGHNFTKIVLPSTLQRVDSYAFYGNAFLQTIIINFDNPKVFGNKNEPNLWLYFGNKDGDRSGYSYDDDYYQYDDIYLHYQLKIYVPDEAKSAFLNTLADNSNYYIYKHLYKLSEYETE